ncbi:MAG: hypothetical protein PUF40_14500, partial [Blautia massiliensis]|nr:hypothetical protein [Blautia massiliensis (ex Durand et al. 2017)]
MSDLICGKAAVGGNYNSTRDTQFGLNVFEGIPCYWNDEEKQLYAFRLDDHYDRLLRSVKLIQLDCKYTKNDMVKAFTDVIKANEYDENLSVR